MRIGGGQVALWTTLRQAQASSGSGTGDPSPTTISGLVGWWDASAIDGFLDLTAVPIVGWNLPAGSLASKCPGGCPLTPYSFGVSAGLPMATPRLNGQLGGAGRVAGGANTLAPALDPDLGFSAATLSYGSGESWTCFLVWSRPNWRQNSGRDAAPITLMTLGTCPIVQVDSSGGGTRLMLFPGATETVLSSSLERRHTHSIVLRYTVGAGVDVWLDATQVATAASAPQSFTGGPLIFLHDTTGTRGRAVLAT